MPNGCYHLVRHKHILLQPAEIRGILTFLYLCFPVSLQPFEYDPQEKNRHKFMVQAMFAPEGDINPDTLVSEKTMLDMPIFAKPG